MRMRRMSLKQMCKFDRPLTEEEKQGLIEALRKTAELMRKKQGSETQ